MEKTPQALKGKKIILGITGGIAAYKMHAVVRHLKKLGAEIQIIFSPCAEEFVTKLSFSTMSERPVYSEFYSSEDGSWNNHVELGLWADLLLIAPCTANTLAKMAHGMCDNLLLAVYLSAKCPVMIAPAMDLDMYAHPGTQRNLSNLESFGNQIIPVGDGALASGLSGKGRLAEEEVIMEYVNTSLSSKNEFKGKNVLITAGPTHEPLDPVRFIGNRSSGKMGYALADKAAQMGAMVTLISGPTNLVPQHPNIKLINVETAQEMYDVALKNFSSQDLVIAAAAVADYRPKNIASQKIKKNIENGDSMQIELIKNPDILQEMGKRKTDQILVGFALETTQGLKYAKEKLSKKNADVIVLNTLEDEGAGFGTDTNKIYIITEKDQLALPLMPKVHVAQEILTFCHHNFLK